MPDGDSVGKSGGKSVALPLSAGMKSLQESRPKSLSVEVLSSRNKVSVTVDGTTVSLDN